MNPRTRALAALVGLVSLAGGCGSEEAPDATGASATASVASGTDGSGPAGGVLDEDGPTARVRAGSRVQDTLDVASSEPVLFPLGYGREPTPEEIARLDIDVEPDGTGLPPGSGTVPEGAEVYQARCAACHGPEGEGTPAGWPLVGRNPGDAFDFHESVDKELQRTIGNYWPYATTVFDYTRRAMPYDAPGTLTDDEVYAVTAWMLWRNRVIGHEEVMDAETLPDVRMPAYNRFIPDDRPPDSLP